MARGTVWIWVVCLAACGDPTPSESSAGAAAPLPGSAAGTSGSAVAISALCERERSALAQLPNARDLGGAPTPRGASPCGRYLRMAALNGLKQAGCDAFAALGVRTVLDIRSAGERAIAPDSRCVTTTAKVVAAPLPAPNAVGPAAYLSVFHTDASIKTIFGVLSDENAWPVAIHCTYGRDRTGIVSALLLQVQGADDGYILEDYQRTQEAGLSTTPASLEAVLETLKAEGGAAAHLASIGITPEQLAALH